MGKAKQIILKIIPREIANEFVKKNHYSKTVMNNSVLHFGCFIENQLHGVMQFGSPMDKRKVLPLVADSNWNEMLELNRMAFDEYLPKNSESRCIAIAIKLIKKNAPHIKWILSYSDGTQCGDGTIYRASGFHLTGIKKNTTILKWNGRIVSDLTLNTGKSRSMGFNAGKAKKEGAKPLQGFQLRYILLIDKSCKITVPILPFSAIDEYGAGMAKGKKITLKERQRAHEVNIDKRNAPCIETGGANPTRAL